MQKNYLPIIQFNEVLGIYYNTLVTIHSHLQIILLFSLLHIKFTIKSFMCVIMFKFYEILSKVYTEKKIYFHITYYKRILTSGYIFREIDFNKIRMVIKVILHTC